MTFDEICESQDFNHDQVFVTQEEYNAVTERVKLAEGLMAELWGVANFTSQPYLITSVIGRYREQYPVAFIAEQ